MVGHQDMKNQAKTGLRLEAQAIAWPSSTSVGQEGAYYPRGRRKEVNVVWPIIQTITDAPCFPSTPGLRAFARAVHLKCAIQLRSHFRERSCL